MATRYWTGGSGNWNDTAHWSLTDNGTGGESIPTSADDVQLRRLVTVTVPAGYTASCKELRTAALAGTLTVAATGRLNIYGYVWVTGNIPNAYSFQGAGTYAMVGTGSQNIYGVPFSPPILVCNGATVVAIDSLVLGSVTVEGGIFLTSGLNCTTLTLTGGSYYTGSASVTAETLSTSGSTARSFFLGSSTITLTGATAVDFSSITNLTIDAGSSTIAINGSVASQIMDFGGATIHNLTLNNASATSFQFTGNVTANRIASARSGSYTVNIDTGKTLTVTEWEVTGTVGNTVTLKCTTADVQANITKVGGGTSTTSYMSVKDINALPLLTFVSINSTDAGNNTNWFFDAFYKPNTLFYGSPM